MRTINVRTINVRTINVRTINVRTLYVRTFHVRTLNDATLYVWTFYDRTFFMAPLTLAAKSHQTMTFVSSCSWAIWKVGEDLCEMDVGSEKIDNISINDSPGNFSENRSRTTRLSRFEILGEMT